jgi:hypothetical protein
MPLREVADALAAEQDRHRVPVAQQRVIEHHRRDEAAFGRGDDVVQQAAVEGHRTAPPGFVAAAPAHQFEHLDGFSFSMVDGE